MAVVQNYPKICKSVAAQKNCRNVEIHNARFARLSQGISCPVAHKARTNYRVMDTKSLALGLTESPSCPVAHKARYHCRVNATQALLRTSATGHFGRVPHRHSLH